MEFSIYNEKVYKEIKRRIRRLQQGGTIDSLLMIGANTDNQIGASFLSLKDLAKNYSTDELIARVLWGDKKREEQIFACFLFPDNLSKEKLLTLIDYCLSLEIAEYFGSMLLARQKAFKTFIADWQDTNNANLQVAILTSIARYNIINQGKDNVDKNLKDKIVNRKYTNKYVQIVASRQKI